MRRLELFTVVGALAGATGCAHATRSDRTPAVPRGVGGLTVVVRDSATRAPLVGGVVRLFAADGAAVHHLGGSAEDPDAVVRLAAVPEGAYILRSLRIGWGERRIPVRVVAGRHDTLTVAMLMVPGCVLGANAVPVRRGAWWQIWRR